MKALFFSILGGLIFPAVLLAQDVETVPSLTNPGYIPEPEWFKESFLDIREDVAEAAEQDKRVLLYFHQDGCPYCEKLIKDNFGQHEISELTQQYFDSISLNLWGDREVTGFDGEVVTEKEFATSLRVQFTPTILLLNENAEVVLRMNGYYHPGKFIAALNYAGGKLEGQGSFRDYLAATPVAQSSGELHNDASYLQAPYQFADRKSDKPLLVMFEQKQCLSCDELHTETLTRKDSQELLAGFDIALLDMWSADDVQTPDGRVIPVRQWAADLGVAYTPSMVFFDEKGAEVFRTEGYFRGFHLNSGMSYVLEKAYLTEPEFQRYVEAQADARRAKGNEVNIME